MRSRLLLLVAAAVAVAGCEQRVPVEGARLVAPSAGVPVETYTLADETRPVLVRPAETRVVLTVPAGLGDAYTFELPPPLAEETLVATGVWQRGKHVYPFYPQWVEVTSDPDGRRGRLTLPPLARGPGEASALTLILTALPAVPTVETRADALTIPAGAELHFAYALSEAAGAYGAAPVSLEILAEDAEHHVHALWTTTLQLQSPAPARWHEAVVSLADYGGEQLTLIFRARAAGEGRPVLVPLWGDPVIVHPGTRPRARRNVILISLDTLRADRVGVYGAYRPTTPAIDALATDAVIFADAWAPWPETSGSHMSLFTSRFPSEHGVTGFVSTPPPSLELLAERLRREGYLTRAFTEDGGVWAFAGFARGFSAYSERRSPDFVYRGEAAATFDDAAHWLESHAQRTFFLFVHTYQVHAPYAPPPGYQTLFADIAGRESPAMAPAALAYDRETRFTDDQVGRFLATLARLGLAERSIVIVTSDHGEEFGEHGGTGHGRTLYREVLQVPLIIHAPGLLAPARVTTPASLLDVYPTLLELLALAPEPGQRGVSLVGAARAAAIGGTPAASAERPIVAEVDRVDRTPVRMVSVRRGGRTAILDLTDDSARCYAADDAVEVRPGSTCPDLLAVIAEHRAAMRPIGGHAPAVVDPRLVEKMRALGYVQ